MSDQQMMETDSASASSNDEYIRWEKHRDLLFKYFSDAPSVSSLATELVSCSLINDVVYERVTDTERFTEDERAKKLVMFLYKQVKKNPSVFETFMENLNNCGSYFKSATETLRAQVKDENSKKTINPEAVVLLRSTATLTSHITGNLVEISGQLRQCDAITSGQHNMIVDPQHQHTNLCLDTILDTIGKQIALDSEKLEVFTKMLENMGAYYKDVCKALRTGQDIN